MEFSPSLADRLAASSAAAIDEVVRQLCKAIRPQGSTLSTTTAWRFIPHTTTSSADSGHRDAGHLKLSASVEIGPLFVLGFEGGFNRSSQRWPDHCS
jgi:hypothetical protein